MRLGSAILQPMFSRRTAATTRPRAAATRWHALVALAALSALATPGEAHAGKLCRTAMFQCGGPIAGGTNLRKAIQSKARAKLVLKHCRPFYTSLEPDRCDWRRTLRVRRLASAPRAVPTAPRYVEPPPTSAGAARTAPTQPGASNPGAAQGQPARQPLPPPQPVVPRRDVRGRYSTTPAPARIPRVTAQDRAPFAAEVRAAASRYKLPENLVRAVMKVESGYNPTVVSHAGAIGLMQLLPETAKAMGVRDPRDPRQSIFGGARFIRILANRFRGDLVKVLSAYHAGSTRVKRRGGTPYAATDSYVRKVLGVYYALQDR